MLSHLLKTTLFMAAAMLPAADIVQVGSQHRSLFPAGKEVDVIYGDFLLRSDKIVATIGGPPSFRDANVNTQSVQGAVIDLARLDLPAGDNDLLSAYYPHGHYLDVPAADRAEIVQAHGPEVKVRFYRSAGATRQGDPVDVMTEYSLRDGEPFLHITTTYTNSSTKTANAAVYDKMRADTLFRIPPAGESQSLIYYEPWHRMAYGVVRAGGAPILSYANPANKTYNQDGGNRLDFPELLSQEKGVAPIGPALPMPSPIAAGKSITVKRYLVPGRHPADIQKVIANILGYTLKPFALRVIDDRGQPVAGATVVAQRSGTVLSEGWTDAEGRLELALPDVDGSEMIVSQRGRAEVRLKIKNSANSSRELSITVGPLAEAVFDVVDTTSGRSRGPVKVVLRGIDGTPDPDFGPHPLPYQAGNLCFSRDGRFRVALPPGRYEALIGRGPEYIVETRRFETAYGRSIEVDAEIRRAFESPGWVIADFHNHTTNSNDSIADPAGRVVGIAASGVEFAPATEHNRISTLQPHIETQKLTAFLHSAGGIELSGRPGPGAINHQNSFPLRVQEGMQGGGAPRTDRDPKVQISRLYNYDDGAEKFVEHNHPDVAWLYYDKNRDGKVDEGFGTRPYTHAIEINRGIINILKPLEEDGRSRASRRDFFWLQMLNQGDRIFGVANSDAHVTRHNNGSIFMYLKSSVDEPALLNPLELARAAKAGQIVMSNGPFLEVSVNGSFPGSEVRATAATALRIRVQCAPRLDIDRIQVLINGRPDASLNFTRAQSSEGFQEGDGPLRFERLVPLRLNADAHVIVVAIGESFQLGPFVGDYADQPPVAVSNPIFVDVDGDGFTSSKDTLGAPLPVKRSVAVR